MAEQSISTAWWFLLALYVKCCNIAVFSLFSGGKFFPNAGKTAGFLMWYSSILILKALSNTTNDLYGIRAQNLFDLTVF